MSENFYISNFECSGKYQRFTSKIKLILRLIKRSRLSIDLDIHNTRASSSGHIDNKSALSAYCIYLFYKGQLAVGVIAEISSV